MRIFHLTAELSGGAGVAAQRLHDALKLQEMESHLYYKTGTPLVAGCQAAFENGSFLERNLAALTWSWRHRRNAKDKFVTSPRWFQRTPLASLGSAPDVVNLHWLSRWIDHPSFFASLPVGLPIVWSLHDMNPLTGGCHHAGSCERFTSHCGHCPQLKHPAKYDDSYRFFEIKKRCYAGKNLHIVGNSEWTTAQARRSALMQYAKSFHTIPLGLDTTAFQPIEKKCAREALRISPQDFVVGFACADFSDKDKGSKILVEILHALANEAKITLLAFGTGRLPDNNSRYNTIELGTIHSPRLQSLFYSACDVFATPSKIESFGLTALEAMACGTPVVAYHTGGLPEIVMHGETGLLEKEIGSKAGLYNQLKWMLCHTTEREQMGRAARKRVEENFTRELMARRYAELYHSVTSR